MQQQKKATPESLKERPVLATILDVLLLFMRQNLKKKLPSDLYWCVPTSSSSPAIHHSPLPSTRQ